MPPTSRPRALHAVLGAKKLAVMGGGGALAPHLVWNGELLRLQHHLCRAHLRSSQHLLGGCPLASSTSSS